MNEHEVSRLRAERERKRFGLARSEARNEIVWFVEDHGGSLGGESRDELDRLLIAYVQVIRSYERTLGR